MQGFLEYVVRKLVDHPDEVCIECLETGQTIEFRLTLHPSDIGKVIGRHGKTIGALRTLINSTATKHGKRALVEINDDAESEKAEAGPDGDAVSSEADRANS